MADLSRFIWHDDEIESRGERITSYRVDAKAVMVLEDGKWRLLKEHGSHADALAHLKTLEGPK